MSDNIAPRVVRFADFCKMIGCKTTTGYKLINATEVESYLEGSARMVVVESIDRFIERRRQQAAAAEAIVKRPVKSARSRAVRQQSRSLTGKKARRAWGANGPETIHEHIH